jgi:curved DNA-binding protein CbpA
VINLAKDPKGYYVALGVGDGASLDDIKTAFRTKAKKLHSDRNPSRVAAKQFHRIHEAYETLSDPVRRAAYDRGWRTVNGGPNAGSQPPPRQEPPRAEASAHGRTESAEQPRREPPRTERAPDGAAVEQAAVCKCGTVTAQPRYIVFDMVLGRLSKVQRRGLGGVYCRVCADRTAVRASLITWLAGWWALPDGQRETVKAILSNMRGGRRSIERNARLLIRQARAFRARGEMELARGCAEQALSFAANPGLRREVDSLLLTLSAFPARALKDRWARPGLASMIQALPLATIMGAVAMVTTLSAPRSLSDMVATALRPAVEQPVVSMPVETRAAPAGQVYAVVPDRVALRTGPGATFQVIETLATGAIVIVVESDADGAWVRAVTPSGAVGFLAMADLTTKVSADALGAFGPRGD